MHKGLVTRHSKNIDSFFKIYFSVKALGVTHSSSRI